MPRRYDAAETKAILQRAAELQVTTRSSSELSTLEELQDAARAAGIPPELVRRAALELERPTDRGRRRWLGAPSQLSYEASLPGEFDDAYAGHVAELIGDHLREFGHVQRIGRDFVWQTGARDMAQHNNNLTARQLRVSLAPRDGVTRLRIEERLSALVGGMFGGLLGGLGGGTIVIPLMLAFRFGAPWSAPLFVAAWLGVAYALTRRSFAFRVRQRDEQLRQLRDRLIELLSEAGPLDDEKDAG